MQRIVLGLVTILLPLQSANAGAWTQEKGGAFFKAATRFVRADTFYDPNGEPLDTATFGDNTVSLYGEYGIVDGFTVVANLPLRTLTLNRQVGKLSSAEQFSGDRVTAIGDGELALRGRLARIGSSVFSAQFTVGIPVGISEQENGLVTGDGEADTRLEFHYGHGFSGVPLYLGLFAGYAKRFRGFSDEYRYGGELGYTFFNRALLILKANGVRSRKNNDDPFEQIGDGNLVNNQSYLAYGPELNVRITGGLGVSALLELAALAENVYAAPALTVGLTYSH